MVSDRHLRAAPSCGPSPVLHAGRGRRRRPVSALAARRAPESGARRRPSPGSPPSSSPSSPGTKIAEGRRPSAAAAGKSLRDAVPEQFSRENWAGTASLRSFHASLAQGRRPSAILRPIRLADADRGLPGLLGTSVTPSCRCFHHPKVSFLRIRTTAAPERLLSWLPSTPSAIGSRWTTKPPGRRRATRKEPRDVEDGDHATEVRPRRRAGSAAKPRIARHSLPTRSLVHSRTDSAPLHQVAFQGFIAWPR